MNEYYRNIHHSPQSWTAGSGCRYTIRDVIRNISSAVWPLVHTGQRQTVHCHPSWRLRWGSDLGWSISLQAGRFSWVLVRRRKCKSASLESSMQIDVQRECRTLCATHSKARAGRKNGDSLSKRSLRVKPATSWTGN